MRASIGTLLAKGSLVAAVLLAAHCGGATGSDTTSTPLDGGPNPVVTVDGGKQAVVDVHRPTPVACEETRGPGHYPGPNTTDAGPTGPLAECVVDEDCTEGKNGRCFDNRGGKQCNYDACATDSECAAGEVCHCGVSNSGYPRNAHACKKGNCRVDGDCASGACSPSLDAVCGNYTGVVGYFCRTSADTCVNDRDCKDATKPEGFCAWQPAVGRWACSYGSCVG